MAESRSLARPEKALAVSDKSQIVGDVDPALVHFAQDGLRPAGARIGEEQVELVLRAREALDGHAAGIRQPAHARQKHRLVGPGVHPVDPPAVSVGRRPASIRHDYHSDACDGIGRTGDRVALLDQLAAVSQFVHQWIFRDRAFVQLQKSNLARIRRPPVRRLQVELFRIHPVQLAIQQCFAAAACQLPGPARRGGNTAADAHHPDVVIAKEADPSSVG